MMQNKKLPTVEWSKKLDIQGGTQPPRSQFIDTPEEGYIRLIQIRDFESEKYVTYVPKTSKLKTCNKEDLFIARYGASIGRILRGLEGAYNVALAKVILKDDTFNKDFLYYFLQSNLFQNHIHRISSRSAQSGFNKNDLASIPVPNPFIKEQQKIAAILSSVDQAIEKTEQIIEQTERVKKGLMQELLTKGIGHTEFKDSPFGKIPVNWTTNLISDIAIVNPEQLNSKTSDDYTVNYIDISSIENHKISDISVYDFKNAPSRARRILKTNDIIVSTVRPYLRGFAYIQECYNNFICSTGFSVIRCESNCLSNYLFHVILSDKFINYLISNMTGTSFPAVKADDIKNFNFPLPPLDEQKEIANILDQYKTKVSIERRKMTKLKLIKQGLMQELLTGKKRVKVDDSEEVLS